MDNHTFRILFQLSSMLMTKSLVRRHGSDDIPPLFTFMKEVLEREKIDYKTVCFSTIEEKPKNLICFEIDSKWLWSPDFGFNALENWKRIEKIKEPSFQKDGDFIDFEKAKWSLRKTRYEREWELIQELSKKEEVVFDNIVFVKTYQSRYRSFLMSSKNPSITHEAVISKDLEAWNNQVLSMPLQDCSVISDEMESALIFLKMDADYLAWKNNKHKAQENLEKEKLMINACDCFNFEWQNLMAYQQEEGEEVWAYPSLMDLQSQPNRPDEWTPGHLVKIKVDLTNPEVQHAILGVLHARSHLNSVVGMTTQATHELYDDTSFLFVERMNIAIPSIPTSHSVNFDNLNELQLVDYIKMPPKIAKEVEVWAARHAHQWELEKQLIASSNSLTKPHKIDSRF